jgi:hypothetical protein
MSGDIVAGVFFHHDNPRREMNADRIGIRLLRDQFSISLEQAQAIADVFKGNPPVPPYYLPGPQRAQWIVDCYSSHDNGCRNSQANYASHEGSGQHPAQEGATGSATTAAGSQNNQGTVPEDRMADFLATFKDAKASDFESEFQHLIANSVDGFLFSRTRVNDINFSNTPLFLPWIVKPCVLNKFDSAPTECWFDYDQNHDGMMIKQEYTALVQRIQTLLPNWSSAETSGEMLPAPQRSLLRKTTFTNQNGQTVWVTILYEYLTPPKYELQLQLNSPPGK